MGQGDTLVVKDIRSKKQQLTSETSRMRELGVSIKTLPQKVKVDYGSAHL